MGKIAIMNIPSWICFTYYELHNLEHYSFIHVIDGYSLRLGIGECWVCIAYRIWKSNYIFSGMYNI